MRRVVSGIAMGVGAAFLIAALLIVACDLTATDPNNYIAIHERIATDTGLTKEGIARADVVLAEFLRGKGGLEYEDSVYGKQVPVFNAREIAHMNDVYALFNDARAIMAHFALVGAALFVAAALLYAKNIAKRACVCALWALGAIVFILAVGVIYVATDFSQAFILMHGVLFNNDLWLLDARTDLMIRLLPEQFFVEIAKQIAKSALIALAAVGAAATLILTLIKKR